MDKLWEKAVTNTGIPYYIDHLTESTQWDHPDFTRALQTLERMNDIHFASYRAAMKLRILQKVLNLDRVELTTVDRAFEQFGFRSRHGDSTLDTLQLQGVVRELFLGTRTGLRTFTPADVDTCVDLLLNWLLNLYDSGRTGFLKVSSAKTAIAVLSTSDLTEKYRYFYKHLSDRASGISRRRMTAFLQDLIRITELIKESGALGRNASAAVNSCFATVIGTTVSQDRYLSWLQAEPQTIVWLPTLHRLVTAESISHVAKCNVCKTAPIVGLRFKCLLCLNYDMCQECFFVGSTTKSHRQTHPTQEYVHGMSSREDIRAFAKTLRNKLSKKHGRHVKPNYLPIDDLDTDIYTYGNRESWQTHPHFEHISKKLAAIEDPEPVAPSKVAPSPDRWKQPALIAPSSDGGRASGQTQSTSSAHSRQRRHLEDLIDTLERENEELMSDIEQLLQRQMQAHRHDDHCKEDNIDVSDDNSPYNEEDDNEEREIVRAKQEILEEQNRQLERQLTALKNLLKQNRTPPKASASMYTPNHPAPPPPYHSPPTRTLLDRTAPARFPSHQDGVDEVDAGQSNVVLSALHNEAVPRQSPGVADQSPVSEAESEIYRLRPTEVTDQSTIPEALTDIYMNRPPRAADQSVASEAVREIYGLRLPEAFTGAAGETYGLHPRASTRGPPVSHPADDTLSPTLHFSIPAPRPPQQAGRASSPSAMGSPLTLPSLPSNHSAVTPGTFASQRLLPPHLADQSTVMFPNLSASRMFPPEEAELNQILQGFDRACPSDPQDASLPPEVPKLSAYIAPSTFMRTRRPPGTRRNPTDMIDAVARIGDAMTTLVTRVTDRPSGM